MDRMGLLNICKLPGMSSHEVVSRVRRIAGMKRVGHTGTLDPSACGVLLVCLGRATRLADYIVVGTKGYRAEITFGVTTDSADAEGVVTARPGAPILTSKDIEAVLPQFIGTIQQRQPAHSAIQIGGRRAYDLIRKGEEVDIPAREVTVYAITPVRFTAGEYPRLLVDITCGKGTYIRSLANDIGETLGVGGALTFLARTRVGDCSLEQSVTLDELAAAADAGQFDRCLQSPDIALDYIPSLTLPSTPLHYHKGAELPCEAQPGLYRIYDEELFLGLGRCEEGLLRPVVNLH